MRTSASQYALRAPAWRSFVLALLAWAGGLHGAGMAQAATSNVLAPAFATDDSTVQDARDALRVRDKARLLADRDALLANRHPLAPWVDYWAFQLRLSEISVSEVDAFLARWPDSYVADRARNDWLLELGRRQDWSTFLRIQPAFRMNDDREVTCLGLLARFQTRAPMDGPGDGRERARQAWWGQKDADFGCDAMAQALVAGGVLDANDVWRKLRLAAEADKPRAVQQSARLLGDTLSQVVTRLMAQPRAFLMASVPSGSGPLATGDGARRAPGASMAPELPRASKSKVDKRKGKSRPKLTPIPMEVPPQAQSKLNVLAFIRWTGMDVTGAAAAIEDPAARQRWRWNAEEAAWAWAQLGRAAAWRLSPDAPTYFERALADRALASGTGELAQGGSSLASAWSGETLGWMARAAMRAATAGQGNRWAMVEQAVEAMSPEQQQDATWLYWKAKALQQRGKGAGGDAARQQARDLLVRVSSPLTFYGQLAAEELAGAPARAPTRAAPVAESELAQALAMPGVDRALRMLALGLRSEGVREWNFNLSFGKAGGLNERELLAVAEVACRREIWDRCINSSERTSQEIDLAQRYPTPFKADVLEAARDVGLDPAYMYGLIRQESRFIVAAKSSVGASGLMQVMPATAAWTAKKLSIAYSPELIADRLTNLRIGAGYLKLILDDFQGAQAMAAAAYNAGPSRPRRWREGNRVDAAAWVENIPFNETRDYVKKVLANATVYGHILHGKPLSIKGRLGTMIGPRTGGPEEDDLP